jgi:hypothetical protein
MKGEAQAQIDNHQEDNLELEDLAPNAEEKEAEKLDATLVTRHDTCLRTILKINQKIREMQMLQRLGTKNLI